MKIINRLLFVLLSLLFISCKNNTDVFLLKSLNRLEIGMRKVDADFEIQNYRKKHVLDEYDFINIDGIKTKVNFYFCKQNSGFYLEGISFRSLEYGKLYNILQKQIKTNDQVKLEKLFIKNSDMFGDSGIVICLYSTKMMYINSYINNITCLCNE